MSIVRIVAFASVVVATVAVTGCPGPEYPKCESDDHCKKNKDGAAIDEYCVFGQCQECAKDTHCGAGEKCFKGRCEQTCAGDGDCADGDICEASRCVKAQCKSDDACGSSAKCDAGRCKRNPASTTASGGGGSGSGEEDLKCETRSRVNFDFNVADLRPDGRATLDLFAKCMKKNPDWKITVEGHCDERGTSEYNLSLGENRAKSIKKYLTALGVEDKRIKIVSYGEERPLEPAATEEAWAKNRRGEIIVN